MQDSHERSNLHCPSCGTGAALTQKFCRVCGLSLEKVSELVVDQPSTSHSLSSEQIDKLQLRQQNVERSLIIAGIGFMALVALSFLSGLIYLMVVGNMPIVPGVVLLTLLLSAIVAGSLGTYSEKLKKTISMNAGRKSAHLPETESPSRETPLISVTEHTTNLLESRIDTTKEPRNTAETKR